MTARQLVNLFKRMRPDAPVFVNDGDAIYFFSEECIHEVCDGNAVHIDLTDASCNVIDQSTTN